MTPTPAPPPAAPLTAEEIAEIQDQIGGTPDDGIFDARLYAGVEVLPKGVIDRLLASHAALRDRLARAEERCVALEGAVRERTEQIVDAIENPPFYRRQNRPCCAWCGEPYGDHSSWCWVAESVNMIGYPDHFATPTDGAARAGER